MLFLVMDEAMRNHSGTVQPFINYLKTNRELATVKGDLFLQLFHTSMKCCVKITATI